MVQQAQTRSEKTKTTREVAKEAPGSRNTDTRRPASGRNVARTVSAEERHCMIAEAAYFIAQQRGFQGEAALDDWLQAETEVDARLLGTE